MPRVSQEFVVHTTQLVIVARIIHIYILIIRHVYIPGIYYVGVVIPFILDVRLVDAPAGVTQEEGHPGFLHLPSAGPALIVHCQKDSAVHFPRRPLSRVLCTHELIVLYLLGMIFFFGKKNPRQCDSTEI